MKKRVVKILAFVVLGALVAWLFLWTIAPFDELTAEDVSAVEISTKHSVNGGSMPLDEDYTKQVLDTIVPIRLCGQKAFFPRMPAGSIQRMFCLVLSDGTRIWMGDASPNFVMNKVQYRVAFGSRKYIDKLEELYFAHPDHMPCG